MNRRVKELEAEINELQDLMNFWVNKIQKRQVVLREEIRFINMNNNRIAGEIDEETESILNQQMNNKNSEI